MRDSVWVIYKGARSHAIILGVAETALDAVRYLINSSWIIIDGKKSVGKWSNKKHVFLSVREAAQECYVSVEKFLLYALTEENTPYTLPNGLFIQEERVICGYNTPVE